MNNEKVIAASCAFIGLAVLIQTGYTVYHDRAVADAEQRQRDFVAKATADAVKLASGEAAWNAATRDLPVQMGIRRIMEEVKTKTEIPAGRTSVKAYAVSDVTWHDARSVMVKGYLIYTPDLRPKSLPTGDTRQYYSWSRDLVRLDDNSWRPKSTSFESALTITPAVVSKEERSGMFTNELRP